MKGCSIRNSGVLTVTTKSMKRQNGMPPVRMNADFLK